MKTYIDDKLSMMVIKRRGDIMLKNPYTPGAGTPPSFLAGRDKTVENIIHSINETIDGSIACHTIYYGLRGVGKTVLLTKIEALLNESTDVLYDHIECEHLSKDIAIAIKKFINKMSIISASKDLLNKVTGILKAFTLTWNPKDETFALGLGGDVSKGTADTGDFPNDLTELFVSVGELAKKHAKCICIFIDEIQNLQKIELSALSRAIHRTNQLQLPLIVVGAGLPTILRRASEAKSYNERMFDFIEIDFLKDGADISALVEPAKMSGIYYTKDAENVIIERTGGYPYFIQEYGLCVWKYIHNSIIDIDGANKAYIEYLKKLDESFFSARYNRTTPKEKEFLFAMAKCNIFPCQMSHVASFMNQTQNSISPFRAQLMNKGLIYAPSHGEVNFTVPQFDLYLKRIYRPLV